MPMVTLESSDKVCTNFVLSAIVKCLTFIGLLNGRVNGRLRVRAILTLVFSNVYCLHTVANALEYASRSPNLFKTCLYRVCIILRYNIVTYVIDKSLFSDNSLFKCLEIVASLRDKSRVERVPFCITICVALVGSLYLVTFAFGMIVLFSEVDIGEYLSNFMYDTQFLLKMPELCYFAIVFEMSCYSALQTVGFLAQATIAIVAAMITSHLSALKTVLAEVDDRQLPRFYQRHTELYDAVERLNAIFWNPVTLWMVECMANLCLNVPLIILNEGIGGPMHRLFWALDCFVPLFSMVLLMVSLSAISEYGGGLVGVAQVRASKEPVDHRRKSELLQGTFLLCKVSTANISFGFFKCICIDKKFVLSFFGGSVTFIVYFVTRLLQSRGVDSLKPPGHVTANTTLI